MQPETSSSDITIHLRRDTAVPFAGARTSTSEITVTLSEGVDLGSVGRALGLHPHTVRLNGYYLSRSGPYYVSPGLSWGPLLNFFAQRGLPCGNSVGDAIVVQGKHAGSTDGNPFRKRKFQLAAKIPLKKRKLETNLKPNDDASLSIKRSLKSELEMESPPKNRKLGTNCKPINVTLSTKRSLKSDDVPLPSKMMKMACSNTNTQKSQTVQQTTLSHCRLSPSLIKQVTAVSHPTIYLQLYSTVGSCGASPPKCTITVSRTSAVDLGLVARVLGVDLKIVCLNGYYVSCTGPHYVSPGLLWGLLLDFFAQRGLPCGSEVQDAIVIQGKFVSSTGQFPDCHGHDFTFCNFISQI